MNTLLILPLLLVSSQAPSADPQSMLRQAYQKADGTLTFQSVYHRKEAHDLLIRIAGPQVRPFLQAYGDLGSFALLRCCEDRVSFEGIVKLYGNGEFAKFKNPRGVLTALLLHGKEVSPWLVAHHADLAAPENLECWLKDPLEYVYDLRSLQQDADQLRDKRKTFLGVLDSPPADLGPAAWHWIRNSTADWNLPVVALGIVAVLALIIALRRKAA